ncbi:MAG: cytochrome c oxidase subunit II [Dehalococcoidia bacterium]
MPVSGMPRRLRRAIVLLAVALLALTTITAASAQTGMPDAITNEGDKIHDLWLFTLAIAVIVFVGVESAIVYVIFAFRRKNDELPKQTHGSTLVEIIWTTIPVVIVVALFTYSFIVLRDVENTAQDDALTVHVQGFQFQWGFTYDMNDLGKNTPDRNAKGQISILGTPENEPTLVIPVDEPVEFKLFSADVIHSFYIRDFLYKLDVVPGRDNKFVVTPHTTGTFHGQCAELCGLNHALMRFQVKVVTRAEFDQWVAENAPKSDTAVQKAQ